MGDSRLGRLRGCVGVEGRLRRWSEHDGRGTDVPEKFALRAVQGRQMPERARSVDRVSRDGFVWAEARKEPAPSRRRCKSVSWMTSCGQCCPSAEEGDDVHRSLVGGWCCSVRVISVAVDEGNCRWCAAWHPPWPRDGIVKSRPRYGRVRAVSTRWFEPGRDGVDRVGEVFEAVTFGDVRGVLRVRRA